MGQVTFKLDLTFAYILNMHVMRSLKENLPADVVEDLAQINSLKMFREASDIVFKEIIARNFVPIQADQDILVYRHAVQDIGSEEAL